MFGHHLITAKAQFEAGLRLKKDDNTVIEAKVWEKNKDGEWEWTGKWEEIHHCDTYAHAKQKLYYLSVKGGCEYVSTL